MMSPQDLDSAIVSAIQLRDKLVETMKVAGAVESMILIPLIQNTTTTINTLESLKISVRMDINEMKD